MIYNYKEIKEKYKNNYKIEKAIKNGEIYKIEKNVYSDTKNVNYLELISKKYPNAIFTMDSAFYFHNLTDVIPSKINLAIERNSSRIKDEKINQVLIIKKLFEIGKMQMTVEGATINVYDKERMLIELIRNKNQIAFDYYLEEYIKENNINKQQIEKSEDKEYKLGNAIWKCLNVDNSNSSDKNRFNDTSIVIKLDYGSTKYLFTGDITDSIDSKIKGLEKVDVLKVAHHGAKESTSSEFLNIVKPTYAIISAGNNENYNHPDQSVIERLKEAGVEKSNIFITKNQGTIWLKSDGNSIIIEKLKELNLDGANKVSYRSIFDICSYFFIKIS